MSWAGADPTKLIEDLAKRKKIRTLGVSMGQGQEIIARNLLAAATADGQWLLLQNTHLGLAYLSEVSRSITSLTFSSHCSRAGLTTLLRCYFGIQPIQCAIEHMARCARGEDRVWRQERRRCQ